MISPSAHSKGVPTFLWLTGFGLPQHPIYVNRNPSCIESCGVHWTGAPVNKGTVTRGRTGLIDTRRPCALAEHIRLSQVLPPVMPISPARLLSAGRDFRRTAFQSRCPCCTLTRPLSGGLVRPVLRHVMRHEVPAG